METIINIHNESEYCEILQQTVAVIEAARFQVAHTIATSSNDMHWSIGKILHDRKLEGKLNIAYPYGTMFYFHEPLWRNLDDNHARIGKS